ncbi:DUF2239 family protein [Nannocystis pusilla]|uniref:DUF2239 family protein n=1 Tax=Nannocystis pusilla TaxID=889268 RepID=UPI003B7BD8A4
MRRARPRVRRRQRAPGRARPRLAAEEPPARTGPGRPKLGVVSREVSLLPRHWEWLERQPSGSRRRCADSSRRRSGATRTKSGPGWREKPCTG